MRGEVLIFMLKSVLFQRHSFWQCLYLHGAIIKEATSLPTNQDIYFACQYRKIFSIEIENSLQ